MSVTLLLFLCISLHTCNARHLSSPDHKRIEKKTHFSIKNDDKSSVDPSPKQLGPKNGEHNRSTKTHPVMDTRITSKRVFKVEGKEGSGFSQTQESLGSVSWRVPHKKNGDENPGFQFHLDYSPPKTHPPLHN